MSRIGKRPVPVPKGVDVTIHDGVLRVKGPKGELTLTVHPDMKISMEDGEVVVERPSESAGHKALHGLTRSLVANMMTGVTAGFTKSLDIVGVGYRAEKKGNDITLNLGYSHPIQYRPPAGITIEVPSPTTVTVVGPDKQMVGQVAADIRGFRPPEPYKGKGIRYRGEEIRRKAGKTAGA